MDFPSERLKDLYHQPRFFRPSLNLRDIPISSIFSFNCDGIEYHCHLSLKNNRLDEIQFAPKQDLSAGQKSSSDNRQAIVIGQIEALFRMIYQLKSKPQWLNLGQRDLENFLRDENHVPLNFESSVALKQEEIGTIQKRLLALVESLQLAALPYSTTDYPADWSNLLAVGSACEKLFDQLNTTFFALDSGYVSLAGLEKNLLILEFHGNCKNCQGQEVSLRTVESRIQAGIPLFRQTKLVALTAGKR